MVEQMQLRVLNSRGQLALAARQKGSRSSGSVAESMPAHINIRPLFICTTLKVAHSVLF